MLRKVINTKQFMYPLLIVVVLIWGRALWQVNNTISAHNSPRKPELTNTNQPRLEPELINVEYDPFGVVRSVQSNDISPNPIQIVKTDSRGANQKKKSFPPNTSYNGYMLKDEVKYGLFQMGSQYRLLKSGEFFGEENWVLSQIERDSCVFLLNNSTIQHVLYK